MLTKLKTHHPATHCSLKPTVSRPNHLTEEEPTHMFSTSSEINLPVPIDDGKCNHLRGLKLPSIELPSTANTSINLATLKGLIVLYCYPMTGRPDLPLPTGWGEIPGAKGCTPQSCSFRDLNTEFAKIGITVLGLSTQSTDYQKEAAERLHLPFMLLSDVSLRFTKSLNLPTFTASDVPEDIIGNLTLIKRLTLICKDGEIKHVLYPVFPPQHNAQESLDWIKNNCINS